MKILCKKSFLILERMNATMEKTVLEILRDYGDGKLTVEEANQKLKEANAGIYLNPNKTGNAWIDDGLGGEVCTVENGKVVGGGIADDYDIIYNGKVWHTNGDGETLVEGPGIKEILDRPDYPEKVDMSRRQDLAGTTQIQKTKMGTFEVTYNDDGYCVKSRRVSADKEATM